MSRQPPFPRGMPPRQADRTRSSDSYYPRDDYNRKENYYRPRSPPPMYEFRGDSHYGSRSMYDERRNPNRYEDRAPGVSPHGYSDKYRPRDDPPMSFTFRQEAPPSVDFRAGDRYRRSPPRLRSRNEENWSRSSGPHRNYRGQGGYRGRGGPRLASEREFLKGNRAPTPDLMAGMDEDDGTVKFKSIDELSDSDEAEMDISDNVDSDAQPKKKQARTENRAADGDSAPKWSNPDPYTALPPPDESLRKKKDMVKLIRKARVNTGSEPSKTEAVVDDFISFDMGGADSESDDYEPPQAMTPDLPNSTSLGSRISFAVLKSHEQTYDRPFDNREKPVRFDFAEESRISVKETDSQTSGQQNGTYRRSSIDVANGRASTNGKLNTTKAPNSAPAQKVDPLGTRKRNIQDEIKAPPKIHGSMKGKKGPVNGVIVSQWRPLAGSSPTPWIEIDHSDTVNMGFWLHKEIIDFYHFVKPQPFEQTIREKLIEDLNARIQNQWPDAEILSFGSFPAGLYLPTADMDLVMVSKSFKEKGWALYQGRGFLGRLRNFLVNSNLTHYNDAELIAKAKVPLVKYVDKLTGLKVDISFENDTGLIANKTFQEWKVQYPAMPMIVTIIKHLLAMRGLNEPVNGGIGGFSVICLVVSLLQHMPQVQSRSMIPEHHLGEVLMEFFNLYGNEFNTVTTGIQLNPPAYFSKAQANVPYRGERDKFMIIDPNNSLNDISGGSSNTKSIIKCFADCYKSLQQTMGDLQHSSHRRNQSILGCILGGNYSSFKLQRDHLAHVHEKLIGPIS